MLGSLTRDMLFFLEHCAIEVFNHSHRHQHINLDEKRKFRNTGVEGA